MESENITIATANAQRGNMIRDPKGLDPFNKVDVLLLSEVYQKRDNLKQKLDAAGFDLVASDELDLAIAVRRDKGFSVVSTEKFPLIKGGPIKRFFARSRMRKLRLLGERNMLVTKLKTANGEEFDVATLHTATPFRPFARSAQIKEMGKIVNNLPNNDRLILGADFNHFPSPRKSDIMVRTQTGLRPIIMGRTRTFTRGFGGQLDDMLYRGEGIQPLNTNVIDVESDHHAIITTFALENRQAQRSLQPPLRNKELVHA
jgi:hypothetical protein